MKNGLKLIGLSSVLLLLAGMAQAADQTTTTTTTTPTPVAMQKPADSSTQATTIAEAATYTLDPDHTYVLWHINHFGFSNPSGKWMAKGTLVLDQKHPQNSKVNATIELANVVTGIPELDKHLQTADFFDVKQFPTATFTSSKVTVTGKNTAKVEGMLTLHGVTKPLTLHVKLNKLGMSMMTNQETAGFTGYATLNRSDFGMKTYLPGLGDKVLLEVEAEAGKNAA